MTDARAADGYTVAWIFWIVQFGVIEWAALANKRHSDTLSEHVWRWFSIRDKGTGWRVRRFSLLAFLSWLLLHFLTGGAV